MSAAAPVNRILPLSTVDGPGCRAAVFLQGCNLACAYCHNPETQNLCTGCGACVPACPAGALSLESDRVRWAAERRIPGGRSRCPGRETRWIRSLQK